MSVAAFNILIFITILNVMKLSHLCGGSPSNDSSANNFPDRMGINSQRLGNTQRKFVANVNSCTSYNQTFCLEWADKHPYVDDMDDEIPFVIDMKASTHDDEDNYFQYVISTKQLLRNAAKYSNICADGTYRVVFFGYPLLVVGSIDSNRSFHLIAASLCVSEKTTDYEFLFEAIKKGVNTVTNESFMPDKMISDAAPAIINAFYKIFADSAQANVICWAHVKRNVCQKTNNEDMLSDISKLQLSYNSYTFERGVKLFMRKWRKTEKSFCDYFKKVWLDKNSSWYEGYLSSFPSTNNACESHNDVIKRKYTFRRRLSIIKFNEQLFKLFNDFSVSYNIKRSYAMTPSIETNIWTNGIEWAKSKEINVILGKRNDDTQLMYIPSSKFVIENNRFLLETDVDDLKFNRNNNFDEFFENVFKIWIVEFNLNDWKNSNCTCHSFMKLFYCKHVIGLSLRFGKVKAPAVANPATLGEKKKRGRPKATRKALIRQ
ncbi:uncharacterized protein LOC116348655 [Contarinia nasturtii]|uniref:uncharacterized protein LOC116348655 n=1 Tax=Contarinia nasturtii TaxID=265458 RepID=UPI0012D43F2F|nr:uncharacterized protein LOC116348655 [Contarinia nasturtii]